MPERRNPKRKIKRLYKEFTKHYDDYQFKDFCELHCLSWREVHWLENYILESIEHSPVKIIC